MFIGIILGVFIMIFLWLRGYSLYTYFFEHNGDGRDVIMDVKDDESTWGYVQSFFYEMVTLPYHHFRRLHSRIQRTQENLAVSSIKLMMEEHNVRQVIEEAEGALIRRYYYIEMLDRACQSYEKLRQLRLDCGSDEEFARWCSIKSQLLTIVYTLKDEMNAYIDNMNQGIKNVDHVTLEDGSNDINDEDLQLILKESPVVERIPEDNKHLYLYFCDKKEPLKIKMDLPEDIILPDSIFSLKGRAGKSWTLFTHKLADQEERIAERVEFLDGLYVERAELYEKEARLNARIELLRTALLQDTTQMLRKI